MVDRPLAEESSTNPCIVLLDEVETLAADRSKMSMEANPVDVHRATDAVLTQLDQLAAEYPQLLFIATSNFAGTVPRRWETACWVLPCAALARACGSTSI